MSEELNGLAPLDSPDLSIFNTTTGTQRLVVKHPVTGADTGIWIECFSSDAPIVRERQRKHFKTILKAKRENREEDVLDTVDDSELDMLAAATTNWGCIEQEGSIKFEGRMLAYTPQSCRDVYRKVPAIAEQVRKFIGDRANFIKG